MRAIKMYKFLLVLGIFFTGTLRAQFYNGSYQEFGQNRIQFNQIKWQSHDYERFKVYFNSGSVDYAVYVARSMQKNLIEIERKFDFQLDGKIEILLYNTQSHFKQSNIGITNNTQSNIGGTTRFYGGKIFIYYEADHNKLDQQIRSGIANVMFNQMIYGGSWKDVLKNTTLMSVPAWFQEGFISYVSNPWDAEIENYVKDGILTKKFHKFNRLEGRDARIAGHAIWNYVAEVKGETQLPNVLYMARMSRNVENGFLYTLGFPIKVLQEEYVNYYEKKFNDDNSRQEACKLEKVDVKTPRRFKNRLMRDYKLSPDGKNLAFVTHELGQYRLYIYNIAKKKLKRIEKGDYKLDRLQDISYPVLCWHPMGELVYILEHKGFVKMKIYNLDTKRKVVKELGRVEKVIDFAYSPDGKNAVMSCVFQGQTDIYLYRPQGNQMEKLTDDLYDDINPEFVNRGRSVIFSSNRPSDTTVFKKIEKKPFVLDYDVFVIDVSSKRKIMTRVTNTPFVNETQPAQYDTSGYTYLTDENGVFNRVVSTRDSAISFVDTALHYRYFLNTQYKSNYNRSVLEYDVNFKKGRFNLLMLENGKYSFYTSKIKDEKDVDLGQIPLTRWRMNYNRINELQVQKQLLNKQTDTTTDKRIKIITKDPQKTDSTNMDFNYYIFKDEKPVYEKEKIVINNQPDRPDSVVVAKNKKEGKDPNEIPFKLPDQQLYKVNFATDYVVSQLDNNFLSQAYQRYGGDGSSYFTPGLNGLIKIGLSDVFEDYKLTGGFRYSGDLTSNEYLLMYDDLSKRMDKRFMIYRQSYLAASNRQELVRVQSYDARYMVKYPFSEVLSLRGTAMYRFDRAHFLATDYNLLSRGPDNVHRGGAKIELILDHTIPKGLNLLNGFRGKLFFEYYKDIFKDETNFFVTGLDLRHYLKVHRCIVWANRLAGSASFGDQKLVYFMGGVDNWISGRDRFDPALQVSPDQNYAFMALGTPLRGFSQNIRNGSNFALFNSELRVPIFRYLVNRPMKSDFLETFQVVPFFDAGTAWTGWNPYSKENSFNSIIIGNPQSPIVIILENQKEPIVCGYGFGFRARLFGYFLRFDHAIGIDDGFKLPPRNYFSLSLDF